MDERLQASQGGNRGEEGRFLIGRNQLGFEQSEAGEWVLRLS